MQPDRLSLLLLTTFGFLCTILLNACAEKEKSSLDIPEGFATNTLKEFAKQAGVEIIFDAQSVYGVKTNPVNGEYESRTALRIMLKDTPLRMDFDNETGAYAVIRIELSDNRIRDPFYYPIAAIFDSNHSSKLKK